ncbi:MAG: ABC transporter permease subunit [Acutalibacter sp.]|jgi:putative aldouronate transport system permease protein|nr:ABC transporter permease subunit [Acutalibacter sp.]
MKSFLNDIKRNPGIYILMIPVLAFFIIFAYVPMGGIIMAFQNYTPKGGFFHSDFVGFKHFTDFFGSIYFGRLIGNTLAISILNLIFGFPAPIIFALLLNEVGNKAFKKTVQTVSYLPYFISLVIVCGLVADFTASDGPVTDLIASLGGERINYLGQPQYFRTIYILSDMWQGLGFSSIIYLAALAGIDQELYEAAALDGANRWRQTIHVTLPGIASTIIILLILRMGTMFSVGYEKIILLYSTNTYETADVISSYVYRKGLQEFNYSYSAAVGLFNSVINTVLLVFSNKMSSRFSDTSLF